MTNYIRLMADDCSSGVWDEDGMSLDINSLPIHYWLKIMINEWQKTFEKQHNEMLFDVQTFSKHGYALAVKLKQNLPDWKIVYFDESKAFENQPISKIIKEIIP